MSDLTKYQVDHLFLLIGENPLPNYVAAKTLVKDGGKVYLVYTTGTKDQCDRLKDILKEEKIGQPLETVALEEYESDAYQIQERITNKLAKITQGKIGLNYTGGTKAMAVHSYRSLFYKKQPNGLYEKRSEVFFSYLDPRRLEMCIDREEGERERIKITPEMVQIKLDQLFKLHGLDLENTPIVDPKLPELTAKFTELFADQNKCNVWIDWFDNQFCEQSRKKKHGNWKSTTDLLSLSFSLSNLPAEFVEALKTKNFLDDDGNLVLQKVKETQTFSKIEHFCKWLDGIWLEDHVLDIIKTIAPQNSIGDYGMNFKVPLSGTKDGFEFDVAFTRGYQLFAISCTTNPERSLCKSKLFEAYVRSQQMGGAEARVALVCCNDKPETLKAEMADLLGNEKVAVFGRKDLINLSKKITDWIKNVEKEAK